MPRGFVRQTAVLLTVMHLAVSVGGEALHLLPAMGHYEALCNGVCFWNGGQRPCQQLNEPVRAGGAWTTHENDDGGELMDADDCPICHLVSQVLGCGKAVQVVVILPFCGEVASSCLLSVRAFVAASYDTRASPSVTLG